MTTDSTPWNATNPFNEPNNDSDPTGSWAAIAPVYLRCAECNLYANGTYQGRKLCGIHLPSMPVTCPACDGAGEVPASEYNPNPHAVDTVPCGPCTGNGAMTVQQYLTHLEAVSETL